MRKDRNIFHQLLFCLSPSCARRNVEEIKCSQTWQDIDWMTGHGVAFELISQEKKVLRVDLVFYQGFTAQLKDTLTSCKVFWQGPSSFNT